MKKILKLIFVLSTLVFVALPLENVSAKTLEEIKESGKIVMGTNAEYPPFEWVKMKDGEQDFVGIDFDLAQLIADEIGVELEISEHAFNALIPTVQSGKIDMVIAGMSYTDERAEQVDFSSTYYSTVNQFVVASDQVEQYKELADFSDIKIGVLKASVQEQLIAKQFPDSDYVAMNKNGDLIEALKAGKVEAVFMDNIVIADFVYQNEGLIEAVQGVEIEGGSFDKAIALAKGNEELLEVINKVVEEAVKSGEMEEIVQKNIELVRQEN